MATSTQRIGIIMNGVTGRMGTNQHLIRSIKAIIDEGGVDLGDGRRLLPDPILVGRDESRLRALAERTGVARFTTSLDAALANPDDTIYFDATVTGMRPACVRQAIAAGKHVYCEKPVAMNTAGALDLYRAAAAAGIKHGVVQDKLWLPGLVKLRRLIDEGFFGRILSVRGEFGYWVFAGDDQPGQRPSWNYRKQDGGGIIVDMLCHWRYLIDRIFGPVTALTCLGATHIHRRWDEASKPYDVTADDSCYATLEIAGGAICHFNSSWCVRVQRDDLLTLQVDGTDGSAVAGLRDCVAQAAGATPRCTWNPDIPNPVDFRAGWTRVPDHGPGENAFKAQWELFLRHVVRDEPFPWNLLEGAKGVQLAELGLQSWSERRWVDVPELTL
jgi:predicted dehydrogenase